MSPLAHSERRGPPRGLESCCEGNFGVISSVCCWDVRSVWVRFCSTAGSFGWVCEAVRRGGGGGGDVVVFRSSEHGCTGARQACRGACSWTKCVVVLCSTLATMPARRPIPDGLITLPSPDGPCQQRIAEPPAPTDRPRPSSLLPLVKRSPSSFPCMPTTGSRLITPTRNPPRRSSLRHDEAGEAIHVQPVVEKGNDM